MNETNWKQDGKLFEWLTREAGRAPSQGEVGTVLARAGVGKTAFLIQLALDRLLAGCEVLHVALGGNLSHVESRYEELATGRLQQVGADQREATLQQLNRQRAIQASSDTKLTPARLKTALSTFQQHLGLHPSLVALDGADFEHLRKHMQAVGELAQDTQSLV
jgi:KaiC/GvpD/RAD55 family RecA-like ATPase